MESESSLDGQYEVECNPNGPWDTLENPEVKKLVLNLASENHAACIAIYPELRDFKDMLDACATYWSEQKILVEDEAHKYGFVECEDTAKLSPEEQRKVALLALSENGSLLLLGNGCMTQAGSSARYQRIEIRQMSIPPQLHAPRGVRCVGFPRLKEETHLEGRGFGLKNTSAARLLYVTSNSINDDDALRVATSLSVSLSGLNDTVFGQSRLDTIGPMERPEVPKPQQAPAREVPDPV